MPQSSTTDIHEMTILTVVMTTPEWFQHPCQSFLPASECFCWARLVKPVFLKTIHLKRQHVIAQKCWLEEIREGTVNCREGRGDRGPAWPHSCLSRQQGRFLDPSCHNRADRRHPIKEDRYKLTFMRWLKHLVVQAPQPAYGHQSHTLLFSTATDVFFVVCVFLWVTASSCKLQSCLFITEQKTKATALSDSLLTAEHQVLCYDPTNQ